MSSPAIDRREFLRAAGGAAAALAAPAAIAGVPGDRTRPDRGETPSASRLPRWRGFNLRCPDATWAKAAGEILRKGSAAVLEAVAAKDVAAANTAFAEMTKACATCHKAHKE